MARVGPAWMEALERDDLPPLYAKDGSHPVPAGSYLTACVLFADLFQESPVGLTSRIRGQAYNRGGAADRGRKKAVLVDLDPGVAAVLQELAWEEARRYREMPAR